MRRFCADQPRKDYFPAISRCSHVRAKTHRRSAARGDMPNTSAASGIGNAIKFTETGSVRVVARLVQRLDKATLLQLDVIDTGRANGS